MNRFNKSVEREVTSELDYDDTKSVYKNIKVKTKKFVPPTKMELKQQRMKLRELGLLSEMSKTISTFSGSVCSRSVYSKRSNVSDMLSIISGETTSTQVREREIRLKEIRERRDEDQEADLNICPKCEQKLKVLDKEDEQKNETQPQNERTDLQVEMRCDICRKSYLVDAPEEEAPDIELN